MFLIQKNAPLSWAEDLEELMKTCFPEKISLIILIYIQGNVIELLILWQILTKMMFTKGLKINLILFYLMKHRQININMEPLLQE